MGTFYTSNKYTKGPVSLQDVLNSTYSGLMGVKTGFSRITFQL